MRLLFFNQRVAWSDDHLSQTNELTFKLAVVTQPVHSTQWIIQAYQYHCLWWLRLHRNVIRYWMSDIDNANILSKLSRTGGDSLKNYKLINDIFFCAKVLQLARQLTAISTSGSIILFPLDCVDWHITMREVWLSSLIPSCLSFRTALKSSCLFNEHALLRYNTMRVAWKISASKTTMWAIV